MNQVLGTLEKEGVIRCYIDDAIILATDWRDMCKKVEPNPVGLDVNLY